MKKWIVLSMLLVFAAYGFGVYVGWDMFIPLWVLLATSGLIFWVSDGMVIRASNPRHQSFLDINQSELDYAESTRKKAGQDKSPVSTIIVSVAFAAAICLVHCYIFPGNDKSFVHNQSYGVRYVLNEPGKKESSVRINVDMKGNEIVTALMISYQSSNSYDAAALSMKGIYADDVSYGNTLPVVYQYQVQAGGHLEMIFLNFYQDEFKDANAEKLIQYLGLTEEWKDEILTLKELRDSETFRYKKILQDGEYINNISLTGEEKYNVKETQK